MPGDTSFERANLLWASRRSGWCLSDLVQLRGLLPSGVECSSLWGLKVAFEVIHTHLPFSGSGILLFIFHANFLGKEVIARLCGPCSVQAVVLNDKFQLPVFLDSHFVYSFSPIAGPNKLFIRLTEAPSAKVTLLSSYVVSVLKLLLQITLSALDKNSKNPGVPVLERRTP